MYGTAFGNGVAVLYFLIFQFCGIRLAGHLLKSRGCGLVLLTGSVLGSVLLQWSPVLFAFVMDFTKVAHVAAAVLTMVVTAFVCGKNGSCPVVEEQTKTRWQYRVLPALVYGVFVYLVISGFEIRDGVVYSSQATYGDMAMHLGFITSIAEQQTFPPEYSILPGTRLSYPFLSDSISSSLYLWGCDIRLAYMLPMLFAGAQVMFGAWLLFAHWLEKKEKTLLAWVLFFLNGGFGFVYFLGGEETFARSMNRLFTGFYQTPTNLTEENIRWVNMIVDMMLPQRATLFGYAVLFTALTLLYRAVWQNDLRLFPLVGILAGALPMIHTHSFLALVLISGSWLLVWLAERCDVTQMRGFLNKLLVALCLLMPLVQLAISFSGRRETDALFLVLLIFAVMFAVGLVWLLCSYGRKYDWKPLLETWGVYLVIAGILAVPQLLIWTFGQASGEGFLRGYFNWANIDDAYLWFYVKNLGVTALLFVPAYLLADRHFAAVVFPVMVIFCIAELVVFQPNVYDNNKLLYVAYLLICGLTADFMVECYGRIRNGLGKRLLAAAVLFLCTISAVLTIGRECVAEYQLMESDQVAVAEFIMENTEPHAKILTSTRHNNSIAALAGRNIQCGSGSYLYFHGLDYREQEAAVRTMYEEPSVYQDAFRYHEIDYILVSNYERSNYNVDEYTIAAMFPCVYDVNGLRLYQVK